MKIYRLQKRACRVILDNNVEDSKEAMNSLKIQSVYDCLFLRKAKFMFKVFNESAPNYITENFTLRSNVNASLVTSQCYVPPKPRTEGFKQSMRYSGCLIWNSLPEVVKKANTLGSFHNRYLKWLVESQL